MNRTFYDSKAHLFPPAGEHYKDHAPGKAIGEIAWQQHENPQPAVQRTPRQGRHQPNQLQQRSDSM